MGKGFFEAKFTPPNESVSINEPTEVECDFIPTLDELEGYEVKFEAKSNDGINLDAKLNGHSAGK